MKTIIAAFFISTTFLYSCNKDDNDATQNVSSADRDFATKAWMENNFEIEAGQLAATKATDVGIKSFAQMMVTDHGSSKTQLQGIAGNLGITLPDSLDMESIGIRAQLIDLDGRAFDSVYIHSQVMAHQKAISLFQTEINGGANDQLLNYAISQLPHLQMHLQTADSIAAEY